MPDLSEKISNAVDWQLDTDPLVLRDAVEAVLVVHKRGVAQRHFGDRRPVCRGCDDGRSVPVWPCPTLRAVASALGVELGEGR